MGYLNFEAIAAAQDTLTETVEVPEWGGSVLVRGLSAMQADEYRKAQFKGKGKRMRLDMTLAHARLCALCMVDEAGKRLFSDTQVAVLGRKSGKAVDRVYEVAARLSGLSDDDEELEKNSEPTPPSA